MKKSEERLLPCPFCGTKRPSLILAPNKIYTVECRGCTVVITSHSHRKRSAVEYWNRRITV